MLMHVLIIIRISDQFCITLCLLFRLSEIIIAVHELMHILRILIKPVFNGVYDNSIIRIGLSYGQNMFVCQKWSPFQFRQFTYQNQSDVWKPMCLLGPKIC